MEITKKLTKEKFATSKFWDTSGILFEVSDHHFPSWEFWDTSGYFFGPDFILLIVLLLDIKCISKFLQNQADFEKKI